MMEVYDLKCFSEPAGAYSVHAAIDLSGQTLDFRFALSGDTRCVVLPEFLGLGERCEGLYKSTCFEIFLMAPDGSYKEWNFAPSGQWCSYAFESYRRAQESFVSSPPLSYNADRQASQYIVEGSLSLQESVSKIGISSVVAMRDDVLNYWALSHTGEKPDFHDASNYLTIS